MYHEALVQGPWGLGPSPIQSLYNSQMLVGVKKDSKLKNIYMKKNESYENLKTKKKKKIENMLIANRFFALIKIILSNIYKML